MRRTVLLAAVAAVLAAAVAAPAALGQSDPFGPLPPPAPEPTPVPTQTGLDDQADVSRGALFLIAAGVLVVFVGIGVAIMRDARRNLTEEDRRALERAGRAAGDEPGRRKPAANAKARARKKGRAQRQARKAGRRR